MPAADHEKFLRRAIELSSKAALEYSTGGAFGAVIVYENKIVAEGMNRVVASHDPTWHAEMEAIRLASTTLRRFKLHGCTLYASGEPCPMCLAAGYWAELDQIYYCSSVEDALQYGDFDDRFIYDEFVLPPGERKIPMRQMLRDEALEVWKQYQAKPDKVPY